MMIVPSVAASSSSSAAVLVDTATSALLVTPDWSLNIQICDSINSIHSQAKDVVKAVKKRLQHKSSIAIVQLLALTLLETMMKNCGDHVHFQIVDRNILQEKVKIVRKKADATVRTKILVLLDSWQEAFGGPSGKYPQYYWTYEELRQSGIQFPERSQDAVPIFTPPAMHPPVRHTQTSYGMPNNASTRLDRAMASEMETLSLSGLDAMGRVAELLTDMLQAATPGDLEVVKDELIVDLVDQCRSNQKRLMQMLSSTGVEELLSRGLELNDNLQSVLAKHDAIASGLPLPMHYQIPDTSSQSTDAVASSMRDLEKEPEVAPDSSSIGPVAPYTSSQVEDVDDPVAPYTSSQVEDVDDEEDDFAELARRHSKHQYSQTAKVENFSSATSVSAHGSPSTEAAPSPSLSNALVLADPPSPVRTAKDQDMIDLLSLALTTTSPHSPATPPQSTHETTDPSTTQVHSNDFQAYPGQVTYNNYVVPQPQPQPQPLSQPHTQSQQYQETFQQQQHGFSFSTQQQTSQPPQANLLQQQQQQYSQTEPSQQPAPQSFHSQNVPSQASQPRLPPQAQMFSSSQYPQNSPGYIPPPWAATPGYYTDERPMISNNSSHNYAFWSHLPTQPSRPKHYVSGSSVHEGQQISTGPTPDATASGHKPFIPSYRLFEDLDVFANTDGRGKWSSSSGSPSLSPRNGGWK